MTKLLLAVAVPALMLAACSGTRNLGLESVHQPVINRADYLLDLQTAGGALATGERHRLAGWLTGLRLGYGDRIAIDDPNATVSMARETVAAVVAEFGLLLGDQAPVTPAPVTPGTVRVVVSRMTAGVPGCPDWSRDPAIDYEQHTGSNYGCASNTNLAAMVANPQHLLSGTAGAGSDTAQSFKAIELYRKAVPTGAGGTTVKSETAAAGGR